MGTEQKIANPLISVRALKFQVWTILALLASLCYSVSAYSLTRYATSPDQNENSVFASYVAANNYDGWVRYAIWRSSLIPDFWIFLILGTFLSMFSFLWFPFKRGAISRRITSTRIKVRILSVALIASLVILEIGFLGWAYELGQLLGEASSSAWLYPAYLLANEMTFKNLGPNQDYPFFLMALVVLTTASLRFRSIWKTLQVISISMIPLPLYVWLFDGRELFVHFENQFKSFFFVTNFDVIVGSVLIFCLSFAIERRHSLLRGLRKLPVLESKLHEK